MKILSIVKQAKLTILGGSILGLFMSLILVCGSANAKCGMTGNTNGNVCCSNADCSSGKCCTFMSNKGKCCPK